MTTEDHTMKGLRRPTRSDSQPLTTAESSTPTRRTTPIVAAKEFDSASLSPM